MPRSDHDDLKGGGGFKRTTPIAPTKSGKIIAFTGPKGCGKSTIAKVLVAEIGAAPVRFAGPLKDALVAMGLTREQVDGTIVDKETPCDLLGGKTPRFAMQTLGTEWGRRMISDSLWVDLAMKRVDVTIAAGLDVVIDDCRFPDEARAVLRRGGAVVRLERDGTGLDGDTHASEAGIPDDLITAWAPNNGTVVELRNRFVYPCGACRGRGGDYEHTHSHLDWWVTCTVCDGAKMVKCSILKS